MLNVKKRLILDADINFDTTGTGEEVSFFGSDGKPYSGRKINASHMPLTRDTRETVAAANVDTAIKKLHDKIENFTAGDVLDQDLTITFEAEESAEDIQLKINGQIKNLNGHTLTFVFPASLSQMLYASITFQDFYNGSLVITGSSADRKVTIYDQLDLNALFKIYRCQCEVVVRYFHFIHQYSLYGVLLESSPAVIVEKCSFSGIANVDSYAVAKIASNTYLADCEFAEDIETYPQEKQESDGMGKYLGEIFAYPASIPPEGAYLLNGQTIYECDKMYPAFWKWLNSASIRVVDIYTYDEEIANTGVCGGFVVNSFDGSVRLPKLENGTLWGSDIASVGQSLAAGLPNIVGKFDGAGNQDGEPEGAFYSDGSVKGAGTSGSDFILRFDASRSNPIYGNSDTVQPPAIRVSWCIQVFNAANALSEQESAQLASQMQAKAQTDFGNVSDNLDFVVETWRSDDGTSWYRKYRSGWVEQFGLIGDVATGWITITLPVEMADANYFIGKMTVATSSDYGSIRGHSVSNLTTTTFEFYNSSLYSNGGWYVSGKAATETTEE